MDRRDQALEHVVLGEIANAEKVKIGNLVQLTVRVKPATKARKGRFDVCSIHAPHIDNPASKRPKRELPL